MNDTLALAPLLLAGVLILRIYAGPTPRSKPQLPCGRPFMSAREQAMLDILERLLPAYRFHAQVSMGALLSARQRPGRRASPADRNAFNQKIVDFVAQDRITGDVAFLIEVDDRSHDAERDRARDRMTAAAGYRTLRIAGAVPARLREVRAVIAPLLNSSEQLTGELRR